MFKNTEGSVLIETAIIIQLCIMCVLGLIGMTVKYHYSIIEDLYTDINHYYGSDKLSVTDEIDFAEDRFNQEEENEKNRIKKIQQLKFFDDVTDQILLSSTIKQKYKKGLDKIRHILE